MEKLMRIWAGILATIILVCSIIFFYVGLAMLSAYGGPSQQDIIIFMLLLIFLTFLVVFPLIYFSLINGNNTIIRFIGKIGLLVSLIVIIPLIYYSIPFKEVELNEIIYLISILIIILLVLMPQIYFSTWRQHISSNK